MKKPNRLSVLANKLQSTDKHLVHLLARRVRLAQEVAMIKVEDKTPIYRESIEKDRLDQVSLWAKEEGINPEFARSLLYPIIGESCKNQMMITDSLRLGETAEKFNPSYEDLRANLINLTDSWAPIYDLEYDNGHPATTALYDFEHKMIDKMVAQINNKSLAVDLGCATGKEIRRLSKRFRKLQGFDISSSMIESGQACISKEGLSNISLKVFDIEKTLPIDDCTVSLVIMNSGTGSDIYNIKFVLSEIRRILKPGGRFVISFYNKEAWTQRTFFPWPLGSVASIDQERKCLEVRVENKIVPIFACPYTLDEIIGMIPKHLSVLESATYPTIASILPKEIIQGLKPDGMIQKLDDAISQMETGLGAYVVIAGKKN